ncbi:uncharacterized protein LOC125883765 isoform X4 [Epinephelus fuscoguttatus]|uniref:uncharacterized protein LOC125883765 isoform X4 n=1 Tax=Epinephelus fuscoguttatus TaxID=293821 RepID=UPI0020D03D29|nr:uncharacterized protein LOC125883765 isoform X4 [Epinephelus fuscoguttatus]
MEEDKQNPEHRSNKVRRRQAAGSSSDSSDVEKPSGRGGLKRHCCPFCDKSLTSSRNLQLHPSLHEAHHATLPVHPLQSGQRHGFFHLGDLLSLVGEYTSVAQHQQLIMGVNNRAMAE